MKQDRAGEFTDGTGTGTQDGGRKKTKEQPADDIPEKVWQVYLKAFQEFGPNERRRLRSRSGSWSAVSPARRIWRIIRSWPI